MTPEQINKLCDCHWQLENLATGNHESAALKRIFADALEALVPAAERPAEWRTAAAARANPAQPSQSGPTTVNLPAQFDAQGSLIGGTHKVGGNTVTVRAPAPPSPPLVPPSPPTLRPPAPPPAPPPPAAPGSLLELQPTPAPASPGSPTPPPDVIIPIPGGD